MNIKSVAPNFLPYLAADRVGGEYVCCILDQACENVYITPLGERGKVGIPYIIQSGNDFYVTKVSDYDRKVVYSEGPPVSEENVRESSCLSADFKSQRYLGLGEFVNELVVGLVVEQAFSRWDLLDSYFGVKYLNGSVCKSKGIHIMEYCDLGNLSSFAKKVDVNFKFFAFYQGVNHINREGLDVIDPLVVQTILNQITAALHYLDASIEFRSGDLKLENIFVKSENVTGNYFGLDLGLSPGIRCKIADYGKSSCTFTTNEGERIRVYNWSRLSRQYFRFSDFRPDIRRIIRDEKIYDFYVVDDTFVAQTYAYARHMGIPFYRSFDFYTFIVSLLTLPEYYYSFFSTNMEEVRDIFWMRIWLDQTDRVKVERRVNKAMRSGRRTSYEDVIKILKGRKLLCGVLDDIVFS